MADVLGASTSKNNDLKSLLALVTNIIDDNTGRTESDTIYGGNKYYSIGDNGVFYQKIQSEYPDFKYKTTEYTHRIFFHWGFDFVDKDLLKTKKSKKCALYYSFYEYVDNYDFKWDSFKKEIEKKQKEKAFNLTRAFNDFFKFKDGSGYYLASLCYYIHILGDHIGFTRDEAVYGVMSTENILYELDGILKNLSSLGMGIGKNFYRSYTKEIENIYKNKTKLGDVEFSEKSLAVLKKYVPKIIKANYYKEFSNKGIILY